MITHHQLILPPSPRGYHIITSFILQQLPTLPEQGLLNLYVQHTSAALTINEAADPDVLVDFESFINHIVPEHMPWLTHTIEGPDDMPAHIKAALIGSSIQIPIVDSKLALGTWQGIYLCEFRNHATSRKLIATLYT